MMLTSIVLRFRPRERVSPDRFTGQAAHAYFFHLLKTFGFKNIKTLHEMLEKPFTISPLMRGGKAGNGPYWIRITSLVEELSAFILGLGPKELPPFFVGGIELVFDHIIKGRRERVWVRSSSFDELYNAGLIWAKAREDNLLGLRFVTPTAFRLVNSRLNMPLPWPRLVFQSLAKRWNTFAPMPLWVDWPKFGRWVTVTKFGLRTKLLDFGAFRQVGFVGDCWFLIDTRAPIELRHALYTLVQFAFYAGVGKKTTMGMGMVRPLHRDLTRACSAL